MSPKKRVPRAKASLCKGCGIGFSPKDKRQKYHNEDCRKEYYIQHYFIKTEVSKTCPNCGTVFTTSMPKKQVYCTADCREDAKNKRIEGVTASISAERTTFLTERYATFEKDGFKCIYCGRGANEGVKLETEDDGKGGLKTICNECKAGKEVSSG